MSLLLFSAGGLFIDGMAGRGGAGGGATFCLTPR